MVAEPEPECFGWPMENEWSPPSGRGEQHCGGPALAACEPTSDSGPNARIRARTNATRKPPTKVLLIVFIG